MSFWKMAAIIFLLFGCAVTSANAQWSSTEVGRNIEITPFGGSRFGGSLRFAQRPGDFRRHRCNGRTNRGLLARHDSTVQRLL